MEKHPPPDFDGQHAGSENPDGSYRARFEALALPELDRAYSLALQLSRNPQTAEDLVQDAFLSAWEHFDRFTPGTSFRAWLHKILTYLYLNKRRSRNGRVVSVDFSEHEPQDVRPVEADSEADARDPESLRKMFANTTDDELKRALDGLPEEQRSVFLMVTLGDLSYQDCADVLGIPAGTVMSRLFRARKQLREELDKYGKAHRLV